MFPPPAAQQTSQNHQKGPMCHFWGGHQTKKACSWRPWLLDFAERPSVGLGEARSLDCSIFAAQAVLSGMFRVAFLSFWSQPPAVGVCRTYPLLAPLAAVGVCRTSQLLAPLAVGFCRTSQLLATPAVGFCRMSQLRPWLLDFVEFSAYRMIIRARAAFLV